MQRNGGSSRLDIECFLPPSADGGRSRIQCDRTSTTQPGLTVMADDSKRKRVRKLVDEAELSEFLRQYSRKAPKRGEPNDRGYDRRLEKRIKRLDPEVFDDLLNGDSE